MTQSAAEEEQPQIKLPDPMEWSRAMADVAQRSQKIVASFVERQAKCGDMPNFDPMNVSNAWAEYAARLMSNPSKLVDAQLQLWQNYMNLWSYTASRFRGEEASPIIEPSKDDRRFKDP